MRAVCRQLGAVVALVAIAATVAVGAPAGRRDDRGGDSVYAVVEIDRLGHERLEALKAIPAIVWLAEVDDQLLVTGRRAALEGALATRVAFRILEIPVVESNLYVANRYLRVELEASGARVLATDGTVSVVDASPGVALAIERHTADDPEGCRGHASFVRLERGTVLSRQSSNAPRLATPEFSVSIQALVDAVDGNRWYSTNQSLASYNRYTRGSDIANARDWLVSQFSALPGVTATTQQFTVPNAGGGSTIAYNVVATLPGTTRPNDWYIVGAHYDAISNNDGHATAHGAEDNGSGSAGVVELARIFSANRPDATMVFVCFAGEEQGLYGSQAHAQSLVVSGDSAKVRGMFNMDMIGYTGDSDIDARLETRALGQPLMDALISAAATYTTLRIVTSLSPCCSDHIPYLDRNMPAVLSIENDYSTYPGYHNSSDLSSNLTIGMAVEILKMNVAAIAQMVGSVPAGNGDETVGAYVRETSTFFLRNANSPGSAAVAFQFGAGGAGFQPLAGDWNGDGTDTIGLYDPATGNFFLRNSNSPGGADLVFSFGAGGAGLVPLVGDWDANGTDTIGVYAPSTGTFFLRNANAGGGADVTFGFGAPGATPLAGDWDGDGRDTVGIYVASAGTWFLRNANTPGAADLTFGYGPAGSSLVPLGGDWNGDNAETAGLYDPATGNWFMRNSNSAGAGNLVFSYGPPNAVPIRGDWNGL